jgi:CheY-like chemotaxis protein
VSKPDPILPQQKQSQKVIPTGLKNTILVAEDVHFNMVLIRTLLNQLVPQAEIITAKNGLEAVQKFQETPPQLIFMDVQMPEMDGLTATKKIRALEKNTHTSIVALTAGALTTEKNKCLAAGMDDFLTKPLERAALEEILAKYLDSN